MRKSMEKISTAFLTAFLILGIVLALLWICYLTQYAHGRMEYQRLRRVSELPAGQTRRIEEDVFRAMNPDYIAWLRIEGSRIDYPVVQSSNNVFYLTHTFQRLENPCGCLFAEALLPYSETDNLIIYGHNMKDGSMFSDLKRYINRSYWAQHPDIFLFIDGHWIICPIFSCEIVKENEQEPYRCQFESKLEQGLYLKSRQEKALYYDRETASVADRFITLSTCYGNHGNQRLIVQAVWPKNKK